MTVTAFAAARRIALSGALGVLLMLAACSLVTQKPTPGISTLTLYTSGGAVRASDGATLWKQALLAPPLLAHGVLYTTAPGGPTEGPEVHAVRASDGATLWTARQQGCCGPLALANTVVIAPVFQKGNRQSVDGIPGQLVLVAFHLNDGTVAWRTAPIDAIKARTVDTPAPFVSQVVVSGGFVVAVAAETRETSYVTAWNVDTGTLAWRAPLAGGYGAPSLSPTPAGTVVTVEYGQHGNVATFALTTGKPLWHRTLPGGSFLAANGVDVFSDGATGVITGVQPADGAVLWQANLGPSGMKSYFSQAIAADTDTLYYRRFPSDCTTMAGSCVPRLSAISLGSGAIRWQLTLDAANPYNSVNAAADSGVLYYQYFTAGKSGSSQVFLLAFDGRDGHLRWQQKTDRLFTHFFAINETLFALAPTQKGNCNAAIEALNARDGSRRWARDYPSCRIEWLFGEGWLVVG